MHGGHDEEHGDEPELDTENLSMGWIGSNRRIRYPVQFSPGDKVWCNRTHVVTITEAQTFTSEADLKAHVCTCDAVPSTDPTQP